MTVATFNNITDLKRNILDELSDGQWHPLYKLSKQVSRGNVKTKNFKEFLQQELDGLVEENIVLLGDNESYRFRSDILEDWRSVSGNPLLEEKKYLPRWFGGIIEDDGWELAPLKSYDLVHFKADSKLSRDHLLTHLNLRPSLVQLDNGLYRVFSQDGVDTFEKIKMLQQNNPEYKIRSMRLESDLKRRDLEDLPAGYFSDLCKYYGKFAKVLLRPYKTSIMKHIPDADDEQQQIYLWVLDAVQRYDGTKSIPFAAYLSSSLTKWVHNLNRNAFGRSVADAELKHSRAISSFNIEHGRDPKVEELAGLLNEDIATVKKDSFVINTVVNLRNVAPIHTEETEIPIASSDLVDDNLDRIVRNSLLSAAIVTAVKEDMISEKTPRDLTGLFGIYYDYWGKETSSKKIKMWLRTAKTQTTIKRVLARAHDKLRKNDK